jgi:hypothetical protein
MAVPAAIALAQIAAQIGMNVYASKKKKKAAKKAAKEQKKQTQADVLEHALDREAKEKMYRMEKRADLASRRRKNLQDTASSIREAWLHG